MADVNLQITESEQITIQVVEGTPINITVSEGTPALLSGIFNPDESGYKITKLYVKDGKLKIKYEDGE